MSCCPDALERKGAATFQGNPLTILGEALKVGEKAPGFTLLRNDLAEAKLSSYAGQTLLISVVPSLDTGVCDMQTRRFNEEASKLPGVKILTVSMDLPFAQARWCGAAGVKNLETLSSHRDCDFGINWGLCIKELRLLARAVFVVGKDGIVRYAEYVKEVTQHPNYDAAIDAVKKA